MADDNVKVAEVEQKPTESEQKSKEEMSPIEEAKKILEETKKAQIEITEERKKIERLNADAMIAGRSRAGQPQMTEKEMEQAKAKSLADEMVKAFR